jgi:hypothetical protein
MHGISRRRIGHTLIELVAAMAASGFLVAGLAAVMMIGRQVAYAPTAAVRRTEAAKLVNQLSDELRFATIIVQHVDEVTQQSLEFVVADRDTPADGAAERIRYEWQDDDPSRLYKTVNGRTWAIAEDIGQEAADDIDDIPYRLTLQSASPPYSFAMLRLRTGVAAHSRVDASIPLLARPEKLSAYWRTGWKRRNGWRQYSRVRLGRVQRRHFYEFRPWSFDERHMARQRPTCHESAK